MRRNALKLAIASVAGACVLLAGVKTGYDRLADFTKYKTYSWIGPKSPGDTWADRIVRNVDEQLASKGWTKIQMGGDLVVSAYGRTHDAQTLESYYTGVDGDWNWHGFANETAQIADTPVGTLLVDIFDGKSKKLVWRSSATEILSAKPDADTLEQSVKYMFRDFRR